MNTPERSLEDEDAGGSEADAAKANPKVDDDGLSDAVRRCLLRQGLLDEIKERCEALSQVERRAVGDRLLAAVRRYAPQYVGITLPESPSTDPVEPNSATQRETFLFPADSYAETVAELQRALARPCDDPTGHSRVLADAALRCSALEAYELSTQRSFKQDVFRVHYTSHYIAAKPERIRELGAAVECVCRILNDEDRRDLIVDHVDTAEACGADPTATAKRANFVEGGGAREHDPSWDENYDVSELLEVLYGWLETAVPERLRAELAKSALRLVESSLGTTDGLVCISTVDVTSGRPQRFYVRFLENRESLQWLQLALHACWRPPSEFDPPPAMSEFRFTCGRCGKQLTEHVGYLSSPPSSTVSEFQMRIRESNRIDPRSACIVASRMLGVDQLAVRLARCACPYELLRDSAAVLALFE
ncbi:Hypothetical protein UVM_LOCUS120 [uncultured virus]|nr:Hypothetical protein UVM_LOCUS120 [uncultured virus]